LNFPDRLPPSDADLIRGFVETGDEASFEVLIRSNLASLRRLVAAAGPRSSEDRDEVLQETLIRIHRALPGYRFQAPFTTWMFRIARNTALDLHRSRGRRIIREQTAAVNLEETEGRSDPERVTMERIRAEELKRLFYRLGEKDRQLLLLREKEGLSMEEIAGILNIAPGTVKSRLSRARKRARKLYEEAVS
jgi:RNA polymerase sigma-70 factor (ECF subfamily)